MPVCVASSEILSIQAEACPFQTPRPPPCRTCERAPAASLLAVTPSADTQLPPPPPPPAAYRGTRCDLSVRLWLPPRTRTCDHTHSTTDLAREGYAS